MLEWNCLIDRSMMIVIPLFGASGNIAFMMVEGKSSSYWCGYIFHCVNTEKEKSCQEERLSERRSFTSFARVGAPSFSGAGASAIKPT